MNFDEAFDRLIGNEGGYSNNPADPGGETMWGMTAKVARANGYQGAMRDMPRDTAKAIYKTQYWDAARCGDIDGAIAFQVFDAAVNHGIPTAVKLLQHAAGAKEDGQFGPMTLAAVQAIPVPKLLLRYVAQRLRFWTSLSTFATFGRGWTNRGANNLDLAADDL